MEIKLVKCIVAADTAGGPKLLPVIIGCTKQQFDLEDYREGALDWADEQGIDADTVVFAEDDEDFDRMAEAVNWDGVPTYDMYVTESPTLVPIKKFAVIIEQFEGQENKHETSLPVVMPWEGPNEVVLQQAAIARFKTLIREQLKELPERTIELAIERAIAEDYDYCSDDCRITLHVVEVEMPE